MQEEVHSGCVGETMHHELTNSSLNLTVVHASAADASTHSLPYQTIGANDKIVHDALYVVC
jgi:hypothetical protein